MAISDMTDLHNWKTKEILCMNSGLSINHRKRKSIISFILALRYPHQEENSSVLTTVQQISYQQKISLVYLRCTFQRLGSIHTEKLSDDVLVSFLTWREMRMVGNIRTYSTRGQIWLYIRTVEDCLGIFPKPYEVKRDLSTSIGFGFIISTGSGT